MQIGKSNGVRSQHASRRMPGDAFLIASGARRWAVHTTGPLTRINVAVTQVAGLRAALRADLGVVLRDCRTARRRRSGASA